MFSQIDVLRVSDPGGVPSISGTLALTVPATWPPISQVVPGATNNLDALDDRLFAATIHKNQLTGASTLWTAHNLQVNSAGVATAGGGRNGSRWYEIENLDAVPSLKQSGTLFDPAGSTPRSFWIPSVAMSGQGHMVLGSSTAGAADFAGVAVSGRLSDDPPGTTRPFTLAQTSATSYNRGGSPNTPCRWGDYSRVAVDPTDDMTMWTF